MRRIAFGILLLCSVSFLVGGCAVSPQITNTPRSSIEQELLVSSLERGFETLEKQHLAGATVTVDFYGLTPDKDFAKEFLIAWLQAHQVHIVNDPKEAQLFESAFERLQKASHKMAEALYRTAAGATGGPDAPPAGEEGAPSAGAPGGKDDVIDAEYTEGPKTS